jgi:DNA polymerase-3 subunit beta
VLASVASRVAIASAKDSIAQPVLSGVYLSIADNVVRFTAADGHRLARLTQALTSPQEAISALIPATAMVEIGRLGGDIVRATLTDNSAVFATDTTELHTRIIDGRYPDFERVIPSDFTTRIMLDTAAFLKAIKLASLYAVSSSNIVRLTIGNENDGTALLTLTANAEVGNNQAVVDIDMFGPNTNIALNCEYLAQAVTGCHTEQIAIELTNPKRPAVLRGVGNESYLHICMPMTVR